MHSVMRRGVPPNGQTLAEREKENVRVQESERETERKKGTIGDHKSVQ